MHVVVLAVVNKFAWVLSEILCLALDAVIVRPLKGHDMFAVEGAVHFAVIETVHL